MREERIYRRRKANAIKYGVGRRWKERRGLGSARTVEEMED